MNFFANFIPNLNQEGKREILLMVLFKVFLSSKYLCIASS